MPKVAIISCYFQKNYGSALQAYATQKILDDLGIENETIRIDGIESEIKKKKYEFYGKKIFDKNILKGKKGYIVLKIIKKNPFSKLGKKLKLRDKVIKNFEKNFKLSNRINSFEELTKYIENFDAVLVGSDQLWLPSNMVADYYTLNWVPDNINKISYATSFGLSDIPKEYYNFTKKFISRINHLSVREKTGYEIIKKICNRDANIICDPTMMFDANDWLEIQDTKPFFKGKYIFCYFLGNNIDQRNFVKEFSKKTGLKIVAILHLNEYVKADEKFADYSPYNVDSKDFLNLIRNADWIFTDSFHASVFSIIYHKNFFVFRRFKKNYSLQTNSRIDTLLDYFNLQSRLIENTKIVNIDEIMSRKINYKFVDYNLNKLRRENKNFLIKALNIKDINK